MTTEELLAEIRVNASILRGKAERAEKHAETLHQRILEGGDIPQATLGASLAEIVRDADSITNWAHVNLISVARLRERMDASG